MTDDAIDDAVHTGGVLEASHGPGSAAYLSESPLDGIGGAHLLSVGLGAVQEGQQLLQVLLQADDGFGCHRAPVGGPVSVAADSLSPGMGLVDRLGFPETRLLVLSTQPGRHVPELMGPAPLPGHVGVDCVQSAMQARTAIGGDQP